MTSRPTGEKFKQLTINITVGLLAMMMISGVDAVNSIYGYTRENQCENDRKQILVVNIHGLIFTGYYAQFCAHMSISQS